MVGVFGDRVGLYVFSRVAVYRVNEEESGIRPEAELIDGGFSFLDMAAPEAYSVDVNRTGLAAHLGPGLLIRLTSHVNLDLGLTAGFNSWGEPDPRVEPDLVGWNSSKGFVVFGMWVGIVIGIG